MGGSISTRPLPPINSQCMACWSYLLQVSHILLVAVLPDRRRRKVKEKSFTLVSLFVLPFSCVSEILNFTIGSVSNVYQNWLISMYTDWRKSVTLWLVYIFQIQISIVWKYVRRMWQTGYRHDILYHPPPNSMALLTTSFACYNPIPFSAIGPIQTVSNW